VHFRDHAIKAFVQTARGTSSGSFATGGGRILLRGERMALADGVTIGDVWACTSS
jgi:hypothetical protein